MVCTARHFQCPPIGSDRVLLVRESIETWARSSALSRLVESFGSKLPIELDLDGLVTWLLEFSDRWDYRRLQREATAKDIGEGARWLLDSTNLTPQHQALIIECAKDLGLIGIGEPLRQSYDYVLVLGGARLSCLLRPRLAAEIVGALSAPPKAIVLLASARPVSVSERDATDTYAPNAATEFDLMTAGAQASFQMDGEFIDERYDAENPNSSWLIRTYSTSGQSCPIVSVSAPSSEPATRRANSADTYQFFLSKFGVPCGSSLLPVTSQIYVPYQQLEGIRTLALPRDMLVETVGFPAEWGGKLQGMVEPTNYLQEIRSTIQAAHRFVCSHTRVM